jgi:hypothetical protein
MADLTFNMGRHGLSKFVETLSAVAHEQWQLAAAALKASRWFTEVGSLPSQRGGADVAVLAGESSPLHFLPA